MRKEFKLIAIIFLMFLTSYKLTYSEENNFNYEKHKETLIEQKLLFYSNKKCEEYII